MDDRRFDAWIRDLGRADTRRSLLGKLTQGGVAAALSIIGISALESDAEAAINCGRKCRRFKKAGKRRCLRNCRRTNRRRASRLLSTPIGVGPIALGGPCTANAQCASGNCGPLGLCAACEGLRLCGGSCCSVSATCVAGLCVRL